MITIAAKNHEAKAKFTADTKQFSEAISKAGSTITKLRSELKLNATQMKASGESAELLERRQTLLTQEANAYQSRISALNSKLELAKRIYGENSTEVDKYATQLVNAQNAEARVQAEIAQTNARMEAQREATRQAESAFGRLTSTIKSQEAQMTALKADYRNIVLEQGRESTQARELENRINALNNELRENKTRLREADRAADELADSFDDAGDAADRASDGFTIARGTAANLAAQGLQVAADKARDLANAVVEVGTTFETSMAKVQALSGATEEQVGQLEAKARELGASTKFTASQVADAFGYMALAGWDTQSMLDGINGVLNLSAAAEMDLAEASDIVTDYLTAFGLSAGDSAKFVDQMTYAMSHSNTNVEQLGEAYKQCAATSASLGYSVEDTTAVIMTMANAGVKGGEAGTALNAIMTRLATNTGKCGKMLGEYGVQVYDAQGNIRSLSEILGDTGAMWGTLGDEEQATLAKSIAGVNHYSKFQTIMQGVSDAAKESGQSFGDYSAALDSCNGTADEMSATMNDTLKGDVLTMQSAFEELGLKVYDGLEGPLRSAVGFVTNSVVPALTTLTQNLPTIAVLLGGIGAAIVAFNFASIIGFLGKLPAAIMAVNAAMAANPIGAVILAVTALIAVFVTLWNNCEGFRNFFTGMWEGIVDGVSGAVESVKLFVTGLGTALSDTFNSIRDTASSVWNGIKSAITKPIETAKNAVKKVIDAIKGFFNFNISWPHIPMPHFGISPSGWQVGDLLKGSIPKLSIDWYAKGGVMTKPVLFGGGEAGNEAIMPLQGRYMLPFAQAVADNLGGGGNTYIINGITYDDGTNVAEAVESLIRAVRVERRA